MSKTLSAVTLSAPSSAVSTVNGNTFTFTCTPSFTGTGGALAYDLKFLVNPAGGGFVTITSSTGLSTSNTNPAIGLTTTSATSITVACSSPGAYTIEIQGAPTSGGSYTLTSGTQNVNVIAPAAYTQDTTLIQHRAPMDFLADAAYGHPAFVSGIPMAWLQSDYHATDRRRIAPKHLDNQVALPTPAAPPVYVVSQAGPTTVTITEQSVYYPTAIGLVPPPTVSPPTLVDQPQHLSKMRSLARTPADETRPILVPPQPTAGWVPSHSDLRAKRDLRAIVDGFFAPPNVAPGEFLASYVSQWHHQHDIVPRFYRYQLQPEAPATPTAARGEFLVAYVSQWLPQHDIRRLAPPRPFDSSFAIMVGAPKGEFLISYVSQWGHQDTLRILRTVLRNPSSIDAALLPPTAPAPTVGWHVLQDLQVLAGLRATADANTDVLIELAQAEPLVSQWLNEHGFVRIPRLFLGRDDINILSRVVREHVIFDPITVKARTQSIRSELRTHSIGVRKAARDIE